MQTFLSRLPKTSEELEVKDDITIFQMSQIEALPVTSKELRQETSKDIELGPLLRALREEVYPMKVTTTKKTIECLRDSFARFGLPRHKTSAPFKPSSNGQAERYVATLKQSLRAMHKIRRKFDVGDRVAVRVYRAANTRWKFGTIVNQDGVLHYIIDVQGTLVRRHVDQIRSVGG
ncbi:transposon Tf2-6 polyprotein [Trichonephila clavipes]|nr:transposon Tf2-6 polyprotein [Trichonephila clavipes]